MDEIEIPDGEVCVWWASLGLTDAEKEEAYRVLSPEEKHRAGRFRIDGAARRFIAARAALRSVLGKATGMGPADVTFDFGKHGKPRLPDEGLHFNASDSGEFVAVALSSREVGIDIELLRPFRRSQRLARRICTDRELEALARFSEEQRGAQLLRLWTCKEAALKAVGTGLPGGLRNVEIELPTSGQPILLRLLDDIDGWSLATADLCPELLCSVVVRGRDLRLVSERFSIYST